MHHSMIELQISLATPHGVWLLILLAFRLRCRAPLSPPLDTKEIDHADAKADKRRSGQPALGRRAPSSRRAVLLRQWAEQIAIGDRRECGPAQVGHDEGIHTPTGKRGRDRVTEPGQGGDPRPTVTAPRGRSARLTMAFATRSGA
jgi:hypothetical protein